MKPERVDDPTLPCICCVSITHDDEDEWDEDKWVWWRIQDGQLVPTDRIYSKVHPRCQKMVDDYFEERRQMGGDL